MGLINGTGKEHVVVERKKRCKQMQLNHFYLSKAYQESRVPSEAGRKPGRLHEIGGQQFFKSGQCTSK